jgi:cytochrome c oxidase assembly factor CtaG
MPTVLQLALESWTFPLPLTLAIILAAFLYLRGWIHLRSSSANMIRPWQVGSFLLGLFLIWVALGSPLAAFDEQLLTVHMIQHLLLMTFAPPLILLSAPVMPLLHGLPRYFVQVVIGPLFRWPPLQRIGRVVSNPVFCWVAAAVAFLGWHIPAAFSLGLQSGAWHKVEHACFLGAGFLFWWPVVLPWPGVAVYPRWSILPYLFFATIPCDVLSGFLVFCDRVVYSAYLSTPRTFAISALADQQCAAALMWACVTIIYLIPAMIVTTGLLASRNFPQDKRGQGDLPATLPPRKPRTVEIA